MTSNKWGKAFWADLAERAGSTLVQALIGLLVLTGTTPVDWGDANAMWAVLGVPTLLAVLKGIAANFANPESGASLLPSPPGPEVNENGFASQDAVWIALVVLIIVAIVLLL